MAWSKERCKPFRTLHDLLALIPVTAQGQTFYVPVCLISNKLAIRMQQSKISLTHKNIRNFTTWRRDLKCNKFALVC